MNIARGIAAAVLFAALLFGAGACSDTSWDEHAAPAADASAGTNTYQLGTGDKLRLAERFF